MKLTGVSATISAAHYSRDGNLHGHTWQVVVWFNHTPDLDAEHLNHQVRAYVNANFDHGLLPDELAWGEDLAERIGTDLHAIAVDVSRPLEGIFAKWVRE